jgi:hypothetical protein
MLMVVRQTLSSSVTANSLSSATMQMIRTVSFPVTLCLYALKDQAYDRGNFLDVITLLAS